MSNREMGMRKLNELKRQMEMNSLDGLYAWPAKRKIEKFSF